MGRGEEYQAVLAENLAQNKCPFCPGGSAMQVLEGGKRLFNENVPLYQGRVLLGAYNKFPLRKGLKLDLVDPNRPAHYVQVIYDHVLEVGWLSDLVCEELAASFPAILGEQELTHWYCRQGKDFVRSGASINHGHGHILCSEDGCEIFYGLYPGPEIAPTIESFTVSLLSHQGNTVDLGQQTWNIVEADSLPQGVECAFFISTSNPYVLEGTPWELWKELFQTVKLLDEHYQIPGGVLLYELNADTRETLFYYFVVKENDCARYVYRK